MLLAGKPGIPRDRVVAVVAALPAGLEQVGSGYLVSGRLVLTAAHCTRDKMTGAPALALRVIRASDGAKVNVTGVVAAPARDVDAAVLRLGAVPWSEDLPSPIYARVDRTQSGVLTDCAAIGYPLFQRNPVERSRHTAELHGTIYQTDEAESGRLLLREPQLTSVTVPPSPSDGGAGAEDPAWGGLSGALVFHAGQALGIVVEHHPRQGTAAVQLVAFDWLSRRAETDTSVRAVIDVLGLPRLDRLTWSVAEPVEPLPGLVAVLDVHGDLPLVRDLDPYRLGTTKSDYGDRDTYGQHDPYVPRTRADVDTRLRESLVPGRLVLVVGPSKVGKTRTAFEAVRARWPQARLAAPDPSTLPTLAAHPRLQTTGDELVVWLVDLDRFLTSARPLTPTLLTRLAARRATTVVVATLRTEARDRLRAAAGELTRDVRAVLDAATTIELASTVEDPNEQAAAHAAYPHEHLAGVGLAERLGYAPDLLQAYQDSAAADPVLHTLVRVAIDWSRTGLQRPVPEPDLMEIAGDVLWDEHPELNISNGTMTTAVERARTPPPGSKGSALLITAPLPGRVRGYHAFDYLVAVDDGQIGWPRPLSERSWKQALSRATTDDASAISTAAYVRGNIPVAIRAGEQAAAAGHIDAAYNLGVLLSTGDISTGVAWLTTALGEPRRLVALSFSPEQSKPRDLPAARHWYEQAAAAGHIDAMYNLGVLLHTQWEPPDLPAARHWYEQAAAAGHIAAMNNLATLLWERWEPPDLPAARHWYEQAAEAGHTNAMYNLGLLLATQWEPPDLSAARHWYEQAAAAGETDAMNNLATLLRERGEPPDLSAARHWYEQAAAAGDSLAMYNLGVLLATQWEPPDLPAARHWYEQAAAAGHTRGMNNLKVLLEEKED